MANIVGCTLGPLLTGFVLMDHFTTDQIVLGLAAATMVLGAAALVFASPRKAAVPVGLAAAAVVAMVLAHGALYDMLYERLRREGRPFLYHVEDRGGVVSVSREYEQGGGDTCYGGGAYDGRFITDPVRNSNGIRRCFMLAALHPEPTDVLEIGLSTASWARVIADNQAVKKLTVVEIGGSYFDIIKHYPEQQSVMTDPKVTIIIDDGRRWLNRNPDAKFDVILQNTTWHWRSHITDLISEEYLRLVKRHLKPGGVMYYNTTSAPEIPYTGAQVFKHVVRYGNFVAVSDSPFDMTPEQKRANFLKFVDYQGNDVFAKPGAATVLEELVAHDLEDQGPALRARTDLMKITDDNMVTEYKTPRWIPEDLSWAALLGRCGSK